MGGQPMRLIVSYLKGVVKKEGSFRTCQGHDPKVGGF